MDQEKRRTLQTLDHYKRQTSANVGLSKTSIWILRYLKKVIFLYRLQSNKNLPKETEFFPLTQIFSSLYICNLIMVLTFDTFKFKLFYFEDFIGWNVKGLYDIGLQRLRNWNIRVCDNWTYLLLVCCFIHCTVLPSNDETLFSCLWFSSQ